MNTNSVQYWIGVVASLSGLIVGLVTAVWAYTKFIVERGLLPPVQFWTDCRTLGSNGGKRLLEIDIHLKNVGSSTLIATDIRLDVRYLTEEDTAELSTNEKPAMLFGRLIFPGSLRKDLLAGTELTAVPAPRRMKAVLERSQSISGQKRDAFYVMPHDSFVQSQIDQEYTFPTAVPMPTTHILVWSSFRYAQRPKTLQRAALWVSRRLGLIQFTLAHATAAHTTERVFALLPDQLTNDKHTTAACGHRQTSSRVPAN